MAEKKFAEEEAAAKEAQTVAQETERLTRISAETTTKVFTRPLASYKQKDDIIILASALQLSMSGTIAELSTRVRNHIDEHPELQ